MRRLAALALGLALGLSACRAGGGSQPPPALVRAVVDVKSFPTPEAHAALEKLVARCMLEKGFTRYPPYEWWLGHLGRSGGGVKLSSITGVPLSLAEARERGYGTRITEAAREDNDFAAMNAYLNTLPPEARQAYIQASNGEGFRDFTGPGGTQTALGGCRLRAVNELYGSPQNYIRLTMELYNTGVVGELRSAVDETRSPRVIRANRAYAMCMRRAGYSVKDPGRALEMALKRFHRPPTAPPSAAEVAMAVADARCQASSRIFQVADQELLRRAQAWLARNEVRVLGEAEAVREVVERAKRILAEPLPSPAPRPSP